MEAIKPLESARILTDPDASATVDVGPVRHTHLYLEDEPGTSVFLVEQTLFKAHRYFLKKHSLFFADMFGLRQPQGPGSLSEEGSSDDHPILLPPDVKAVDFERLLMLFYPRDVQKGDLSTLDEWTSVLALATKWLFEGHRMLAIDRLSQLGSAIDRIVLAREYDVPGWREDAYFQLCVRDEALTLAEGRRLGMEDVILLAELRQRIRPPAYGYAMQEPMVRHTIRTRLAARQQQLNTA